MARRNRVDPWGDLHAVAARGLFTGNRGCLVNDDRRLVRHHQGSLWIVCLTRYRDWRWPLDGPHRWTPLFFLDDAVALAAGHRPCGLCRRPSYLAYQLAVGRGLDAAPAPGAGAGTAPGPAVPSAQDLNRRLAAERLGPGRGLERRDDRRRWRAELAELPPGTVIVGTDGQARLVGPDSLQTFSFEGWGRPEPRPRSSSVEVLTPPTSVLALTQGFEPVLHPSAARTGPGERSTGG